MGSQLVDVDYEEIIHETEKATLFAIDGKDTWIPKSICEIDRDAKKVRVRYQYAYRVGLI
jgi:hypothetical protein